MKHPFVTDLKTLFPVVYNALLKAKVQPLSVVVAQTPEAMDVQNASTFINEWNLDCKFTLIGSIMGNEFEFRCCFDLPHLQLLLKAGANLRWKRYEDVRTGKPFNLLIVKTRLLYEPPMN